MYKKINRGDKYDNSKIFKPRRMVVGGVMYDIDSIETLNKIKSEQEQKKVKDQEKLEQEKNQKVLIKKTRSGNSDEKVVKIIKDLNQIPDKKKPKHNVAKSKVHEEPKKPKFTLTSLACRRKIEPQLPSVKIVTKGSSSDEEIIDNNSKIFEVVQSSPHNSNTDKQSDKQHNKQHNKQPDKQPNKQSTKESYDESQPEKPKPFAIKRANQNKIKSLSKQGTDEQQPQQQQSQQSQQSRETKATDSIETVDGLSTKQYEVAKSQWYIVSLKANKGSQGLLKIFDNNKVQVIPLIKICNAMFLYKSYPDGNNEYRVYFKTLEASTSIDVYILGLLLNDIKVQPVSFEVVSKGIDLWKFRKLYDLEFINYYLSNVKLEISDKFVDRVKSEYELLKNSNYFDEFIRTLKIDKPRVFDTKRDALGEQSSLHAQHEFSEGKAVLYLLYSSIEYENYGYTVRTHHMLKNMNNVYGVTRYGYPFDREPGYYTGIPEERYTLDNVEYIKLLDKTDNFNSNNIVDYIKKYIIAVIKLAIETNSKIIHAATNYWNGIAALYAAKYLGIKSIYEVRVLWEDTSTVAKPEVKGSDLLKMIQVQEKKIFNEADKIITINESLKNRLVANGVDVEKIDVLYNGVDTNLFTPDNAIRDGLRNKYNIKNEDIVLGYIGTLSNYEGIDYILESMKLLLDESYQIKFLIIGDGPYKTDLMNIVKKYKMESDIIYLDKMIHSKVVDYYNIIDIVVYPKKKCDLCNSTSGNKILEAMSMKKPIIVSDLDSFKEVVNDQENGVLCEPDNVNQLTEKIKLLIQDEELRNNLGNNAREWAINNRQWGTITDKLKNIYGSL